MTLRRSMVLFMGMAALSLPFCLLACGGLPSPTDDRPQTKAPEDKPADKPEEKKGEPVAEGEFRLPDDVGGKLVSRLIEPTQQAGRRESSQPRPTKAPRKIDNPHLPLPPQVASLPRLPNAEERRPLLPQLIAPEPLFGLEELIGSLPQALSMPAQERVRIESADVAQPVELPRQAQPLSDRAGFSDPTADVSKATALSAALPERQTPVPFERLALPNPFENQETVKLDVPEGEESLPDGSVRLPKK